MNSIISGEGVALDVAPAGLGSRVLAALIDLTLQVGVYFVLVVAGFVAAGDAGDDALGSALAIAALVLSFVVYPVLCEWLWRGKTLGKAAMGLRVVRNDAGPLGLRHALVRGITGALLEKPGVMCGLPAIFVMLFSEHNRRIGDHLAGTFVVNERVGSPQAAAAMPALWVPPALYGWAQSLDLSRLDDDLALGLRQFVTRASDMSPQAQLELGETFRARIEAVIAPPPPPGVPTPTLLTTVLAERRRRSTPPTGQAPLPPPWQ